MPVNRGESGINRGCENHRSLRPAAEITNRETAHLSVYSGTSGQKKKRKKAGLGWAGLGWAGLYWKGTRLFTYLPSPE